jgi:hypothetical protein
MGIEPERLLRTRETVLIDTPATLATSAIVTFLSFDTGQAFEISGPNDKLLYVMLCHVLGSSTQQICWSATAGKRQPWGVQM